MTCRLIHRAVCASPVKDRVGFFNQTVGKVPGDRRGQRISSTSSPIDDHKHSSGVFLSHECQGRGNDRPVGELAAPRDQDTYGAQCRYSGRVLQCGRSCRAISGCSQE